MKLLPNQIMIYYHDIIKINIIDGNLINLIILSINLTFYNEINIDKYYIKYHDSEYEKYFHYEHLMGFKIH